MKRNAISERLLVKELTQIAQQLKKINKNLSVSCWIKLIRNQLGMSQKALAKRAGVPQSTVSRIESQKDTSISTLKKILDALFCDLLVIPVLRESIDDIRRKQARKIAVKHAKYLTGTMNLEEQKPDFRFMEELLQQEEDQLLRNANFKLWEE